MAHKSSFSGVVLFIFVHLINRRKRKKEIETENHFFPSLAIIVNLFHSEMNCPPNTDHLKPKHKWKHWKWTSQVILTDCYPPQTIVLSIDSGSIARLGKGKLIHFERLRQSLSLNRMEEETFVCVCVCVWVPCRVLIVSHQSFLNLFLYLLLVWHIQDRLRLILCRFFLIVRSFCVCARVSPTQNVPSSRSQYRFDV